MRKKGGGPVVREGPSQPAGSAGPRDPGPRPGGNRPFRREVRDEGVEVDVASDLVRAFVEDGKAVAAGSEERVHRDLVLLARLDDLAVDLDRAPIDTLAARLRQVVRVGESFGDLKHTNLSSRRIVELLLEQPLDH